MAKKKRAAATGLLAKVESKPWLLPALALLVTFLTFLPSLSNGLTNWDDPVYLLENPLIRELSGSSIRRLFAFDTFVSGNYHPLTLLTYAVEYQISGTDPAIYHFTNLLLHLANTLLVFFFLRSLGGKVFPAAFAALLFGIHPMHVESVAWISERKDLLYGGFYLASLWAYTHFAKGGKHWKWLGVAFLMFLLSLLSKALAVSVPVVFFVIDYYLKRPFNLRLILEKVPFFLLAIGFGLLAIRAQDSASAIQSSESYALWERLPVAAYGILMYAVKLFVPFKLSCFYPYPFMPGETAPWQLWASLALIAAVAAAGIFYLRKHPVLPAGRAIPFGLLFFLITLALVLQILPVGSAIIADRYTYLPYVGLFFISGTLLAHFWETKKNTGVAVLLLVFTVALAVSAHQRTKVWKDSKSLWSDAVTKYPEAGVAHNNLGTYYSQEKNNIQEAFKHFNRAIKEDPRYPNAYVNRGNVYGLEGKYTEALQDFGKAIALRGNYYDAYVNRGITYGRMQRFDEAMADYEAALRLKPGTLFIQQNIAYILLQQKDYDAAIDAYQKLIQANPREATFQDFLGQAWFFKGDLEAAIRAFSEATRLNPGMGSAWYNLAVAQMKAGRTDEAKRSAAAAQKAGYQLPENFRSLLESPGSDGT